MLRLFWLIVVGSWKFPWERRQERVDATLPSFPEYKWETVDRDSCGQSYRVDKVDIVRACNGAPSEWCSCGRCRVHCTETCKCETTRPDHPKQIEIIEAPREGGTYRTPPT